ncbi:hypothetical protein, partial [Saccharopolyspora gregorii]|uniref:hypothetical protein n=1 Tax=Saccharopolyspora gregorii TaxID=33914 RepID=UPI0031E73FD4
NRAARPIATPREPVSLSTTSAQDGVGASHAAETTATRLVAGTGTHGWDVVQKLDDWRKGRRSIRDRLYGVVLIPGIALLVLWTTISGVTLYDGFHLRGIAAGCATCRCPRCGCWPRRRRNAR